MWRDYWEEKNGMLFQAPLHVPLPDMSTSAGFLDCLEETPAAVSAKEEIGWPHPEKLVGCFGQGSTHEALFDKLGVENFRTAGHFARWLFEQPRTSPPGGILVASWREAKACSSAIQAAITGDTSKLRRDHKRRELSPCRNPYPAVDTILIIPLTEQSKTELPKWVRELDVMCIKCLVMPMNLTPDTLTEFLAANKIMPSKSTPVLAAENPQNPCQMVSSGMAGQVLRF